MSPPQPLKVVNLKVQEGGTRIWILSDLGSGWTISLPSPQPPPPRPPPRPPPPLPVPARATEDFKLHVTRRHLRFAPPRPSETQNSGLALTGLTQATVMLPLR